MAFYKKTNEIIVSQGNTFTMTFSYKEDGVQKNLPDGYDMIVGLYDYTGKIVLDARVSNGRLSFDGERYVLKVKHDESVLMIGFVTVELTIIDSNLDIVEHATDTIHLKFSQRNNNRLL